MGAEFAPGVREPSTPLPRPFHRGLARVEGVEGVVEVEGVEPPGLGCPLGHWGADRASGARALLFLLHLPLLPLLPLFRFYHFKISEREEATGTDRVEAPTSEGQVRSGSARAFHAPSTSLPSRPRQSGGGGSGGCGTPKVCPPPRTSECGPRLGGLGPYFSFYTFHSFHSFHSFVFITSR